jgi:hypothetical protein
MPATVGIDVSFFRLVLRFFGSGYFSDGGVTGGWLRSRFERGGLTDGTG